MLIFNCTEAASKFFSRIHKGKKITPVDSKPPSPTIEGDELGDTAEQWLVHAITVQRKHVLLVMHVKTRYCMVFADVKKADYHGFVQWFADRWMAGMTHHAMVNDVLQWVDYPIMLEQFKETCREYWMYRRSHRSAQKHIDEIAWNFQDRAAASGCLPPDEMYAGVFDAQMNDTPRSSKGHPNGYYFPDEEMMIHWLRHYCSVSESGIQAARDRRRQLIIERSNEKWAFKQAERNGETLH
ncbi:hypothetical protein V466_11905 [Pseudomonas mandelii PD30]|uniref:DUF6933 domain-containing protein n=1 Tax=Pseudomonas mandelii PD30 TaxID=1419583 RepID=A0A059L3A3_9PSED|nr:hypothetical protein [Pseudomonas mandelii]KDD68798.1 hypothetical protein V466_11905 [Pseudomonas mandelii PD30]